VQCAHVSIAMPGELQKYYYILSRKKPKSKAMIEVARKILTIQWHMLKNKELYIE